MLEMDAYDEPDPDSDLDYEESYSKRSKRRKATGRVSGNMKYIVLRKFLFLITIFFTVFFYYTFFELYLC